MLRVLCFNSIFGQLFPSSAPNLFSLANASAKKRISAQAGLLSYNGIKYCKLFIDDL